MIKVPPPLQTLIAAVLMYLLDDVIAVDLYAVNGVVMVMIALTLLTSAWMIFPAVYSFWKHKTTVNPIKVEKATSLVVEGNYKITRNPMYLGMAGSLLAWSIYLANPINLVVLALFVYVMNQIQIKPEEQALRKIFKDEYEEYCQKVRRWI